VNCFRNLLQALDRGVGGIEIRQQASLLLSLRDRLVGREHTVEDLADLVIDLEVPPAHEVGERGVDVDQPRAEPAEQGLELGAGGFAFQQVLLEGLCPALVMLALLVERVALPGSEIRHAEPREHLVHVLAHLGGRIGQGCEICHHLEEEVTGLVQEGRKIGLGTE